jgi:hypothetical protein
MSISTKALCEWLREHSSGAYRLAAEAATVIEELERENARLTAELAARAPATDAAPAPGTTLKPRAKGWQQCPRCDRLHAQLSPDSALVQAHKAATGGAAAPSSSSSAPIEWSSKDTLEFVRQEYLSSENYNTLRDGGVLSFKTRQLTNLFNGLFEYLASLGLFAPPTPAPVTQPAPQQSTDAAQNAAILAWWERKRPFGWSEQEHIDEPTTYCTGAEKSLALIAVELAKAKQAAPQD